MCKKKEMEVLAQEINTYFMEREEFDCPSFDELLAAALVLYEVESTSDLRFIADAIEICDVEWNELTSEWLREAFELASQQADEDLLRGEI